MRVNGFKRFVLISAFLHLVFARMVGVSSLETPPVKPQRISVRLLGSEPKSLQEFISGRLMEIEAEKKQKENSENAKILANIALQSQSNDSVPLPKAMSKETRIPEKKSPPSEKNTVLAKKIQSPELPKPVSKPENRPSRPAQTEAPSKTVGIPDMKPEPKEPNIQLAKLDVPVSREKPKPAPPPVPEKQEKPLADRTVFQKKQPGPDEQNRFEGTDPNMDLSVKNSDDSAKESRVEEVSLNTREFKYFEYFQGIKKSMERNWSYPEEALVNGDRGSVVVRLSLLNNGQLARVQVEKSSGSRALDNGAMEAVKSSAPFSPFPGSIPNSQLDIIANFVYNSGYQPVSAQ